MGGEPTPVRVLLRGEFTNPGPLVEPGVPSVLAPGAAPYKVEKPAFGTGTSGRRLALARWLADPGHPLTARVMVNRLWLHHFGEGIVRTPSNFGRTGMAPTHPKLLDWLATEFVRQRWSIKAMHRLIMTSSAYRQSSNADGASVEADPDNSLLSRAPLRRRDAEALRDSILQVAGRLDTTMFGEPAPLEETEGGEIASEATPAGYRRSIYLQQRRTKPVTMLDVFDAPQMAPNCIQRGHSTVASQALQLMNSELVRESSSYMAGRIIDHAGDDPGKQIDRVFLVALNRAPSPEERQAAEQTLAAMTGEWRKKLDAEKPAEPLGSRAKWLGLASLCHTILNSAEFLYVD
jgi:hypothetical protein